MTVDIKILKLRHNFLKALRTYFDDQDFIEVETPVLLTANTPDPHIDPVFATLTHPAWHKRQLHTSPELWLKRSLALGAERVYQIGKVFRDDPPGRTHAQEFTMIEWYRTKADLKDLLDDCQEIFSKAHSVAEEYADQREPLQSFVEQSVSEAFSRYANLDLPAALSEIDSGNPLYLNQLLKERGDLLPEGSDFIDAFFLVMIKYVEPFLPPDVPVVISRWPVQLAALAASCVEDPLFCDRFEIYYRGIEIANAYQECFDPKILIARFNKENLSRKTLGKPEFSIDEAALGLMSSLPKTAGIALGIDRLLMAALHKNHIKDLILGYEDQ